PKPELLRVAKYFGAFLMTARRSACATHTQRRFDRSVTRMSGATSRATMRPTRLLIHLRGVGLDPVHRLGLSGKAFDAALVAPVISDDHVPAGSRLIRERLHDRFFVRLRHAGNMRQDRRGFQPSLALTPHPEAPAHSAGLEGCGSGASASSFEARRARTSG